MKRTPFKRSRKPLKKSAKTMKNKLWPIFSLFVRKKNADQNGMVNCFTCGVQKHFTQVHAGHFHARSLGMATYFDEINVQVQCVACNLWKHGNLAAFALNLQKKYGPTILEELDAKRREIRKISQSEYEELILKYQGLLNSLDSLEVR